MVHPTRVTLSWRHLYALMCGSYDWWRAQSHLYPAIEVPGTHLVRQGSVSHANGGFTLTEFVEANIDAHAVYVVPSPLRAACMWVLPHGLLRTGTLLGRPSLGTTIRTTTGSSRCRAG